METIRYSQIGQSDIRWGTGTFEVTLADGSVVTMPEAAAESVIFEASDATRWSVSVDTEGVLFTTRIS